jgi:BlaI family transcriptional regulator, penicillinase repressor
VEKLSYQEEEAMKAIWGIGEGNIKLFLEHMSSPDAPYTTLASTVRNLEKKGYVSSRLTGNAYRYKPLITADEYKKKLISGFVRDYFAGSYKELVNFIALIEGKKE